MNDFRFLHLDDHGRIDEDLLCRLCDYNLRGLEESADCPECSTPIARSARPDLIQFGDPVQAEFDQLQGRRIDPVGIF